jgi:hypothetical protein
MHAEGAEGPLRLLSTRPLEAVSRGEDPARAPPGALLALSLASFIEGREDGPSLFDMVYISPKTILGVVAYLAAAFISYIYQDIRS